ncbi:MAG: PSD1 and planctomycete cytochrome C domain-containing protein [Pirellulales bacterium]
MFAARGVACLLCAIAVHDSSAAEAPAVNFSREVKPILARRCFACHGPQTGEGGLRLHERDAALAELDSGSHAIVPGKVDESVLIDRVSAEDESERMPPEGKPLSKAEIEILRRWIAGGAKYEKHWAFVPPQRHKPPQLEDDWAKNPIDAFVLDKLRANGLEPAQAADRRTLARRAYYDLTGLPPTREQLRDFENSTAPTAWEDLVDKLLDSPHYGEQWARHWLDLVRYAETNSFERDGAKPNAWKYRDYVIRSFNDDKSYDQFLREQLAGDELDTVTNDSIIATGYYRLGIWDDEAADPLLAKYDAWDDIVSTTGQAMLGLTFGCARCHDHKIDPIPQADYYALVAFFADVTPYGERGDQETNSQWDFSSSELAVERQARRAKIADVERETVAMETVGIKRMPADDQRKTETPERQQVLDEKLPKYLNASEWQLYEESKHRLDDARHELDELPKPEMALALARCNAHPDPIHILARGNPAAPEAEATLHFPQLFGNPPPVISPAAENARSAGRRRVLADWIASPDNMLTARVIVNRVWQHHFGRGIVRSANNFGELGTPPTHPELLDYLALWLIDHNWQLKPLHRLIMTSNVYRMSSDGNAKALAADPTNDLMWRFDLRRLNAEEVRDAMLLATGELNEKMYGPSFYPQLSQEVFATQSQPGNGWGDSTDDEQCRRSIYIFLKRSLLPPLLSAFDFPDMDASCEARFITTQPSQALTLLNGKFAHDRAAKLADRVIKESGPSLHEQAARAFYLVLGRQPTDDEFADAAALLELLQKKHGQSPEGALRYWCLTLFNLNEFVYLD